MRFAALALAACSLPTNPGRVSFDGRDYTVDYESDACLLGDGERVRCLGAGTLLAFDFTGDGVSDLALYQDTRDGFRDCFAYLDIYVNDGTPLRDASAVHAKWKEGHWDWIASDHYPGLASAPFVRFMREQDGAHP
ncbi:MAG TPA: hypothetical protein VGG74_36980 [Kofleriaceae bacterium]|jgi:hypothetical protein